ncbi:DNA polymerase III subunit beta, partial [candidate division WOR-3 bacterium]|nr:DNA polymerase III subunit beta [candidate division WOR-3 bacterium]
VVVVSARKLSEIVRELGVDRVTFYTKENSAFVEAGGVRATFMCVDPAEYPQPKPLPEGLVFEYPVSTLHELHDACGFAVSKDESRPAMTGVNWEVTKTETRMVGTDGHRLAFVSRKGKYAAKFRAVLPAKLFNLIPRGADTAQVCADPTNIGFKAGDTTVHCRLIEGPYPDYERVIPKGYPGRAVLGREGLTAVLRRAAVLAHPLGRLVTLEFRRKKLVVRAETPELGRSEEETDCEYNGEELRIGFNVGYMLEVLRRLGSEKVVFELSTPLSAGVVKPAENEPDMERVYLLMPIRLD